VFTALTRPLAGLKGLTSQGKAGKGRRGRKGKGREREGGKEKGERNKNPLQIGYGYGRTVQAQRYRGHGGL